jgi:hypothetical protein
MVNISSKITKMDFETNRVKIYDFIMKILLRELHYCNMQVTFIFNIKSGLDMVSHKTSIISSIKKELIKGQYMECQ